MLRLRSQVGGADTFEPRDQAFWDELRRLPNWQAQAVALRYFYEKFQLPPNSARR